MSAVVKVGKQREWTSLDEFEIEDGSNEVTAKLSYVDDFAGWKTRAPALRSPHPELPALLLKKISGKGMEGDKVEVTLDFRTANPEASYPGRPANSIKRYSLELSTTEESLLSHEMFSELGEDELEGLAELLGSARKKSDFDQVKKVVTSALGLKAVDKIRKGRESYYNPGMVWVERFTARGFSAADISSLAEATNSPPGGAPSAGGNRNWLYIGATAADDDTGEFVDIERRWLLSEKGKWDPDFY